MPDFLFGRTLRKEVREPGYPGPDPRAREQVTCNGSGHWPPEDVSFSLGYLYWLAQ